MSCCIGGVAFDWFRRVQEVMDKFLSSTPWRMHKRTGSRRVALRNSQRDDIQLAKLHDELLQQVCGGHEVCVAATRSHDLAPTDRGAQKAAVPTSGAAAAIWCCIIQAGVFREIWLSCSSVLHVLLSSFTSSTRTIIIQEATAAAPSTAAPPFSGAIQQSAAPTPPQQRNDPQPVQARSPPPRPASPTRTAPQPQAPSQAAKPRVMPGMSPSAVIAAASSTGPPTPAPGAPAAAQAKAPAAPAPPKGTRDAKAAMDDLQLLTEQFEKQRASKAKQKPVCCLLDRGCCVWMTFFP